VGESDEGQSEKPTSHRHSDNNQRVLFSDVMLDQVSYGFDQMVIRILNEA